MTVVEVHPLIKAIITELRKRGLDVEYRGKGEELHLTGQTENVDDHVIGALKAAKRRILEVLKPLWDKSDGVPVRLPQDAPERPEPVHR